MNLIGNEVGDFWSLDKLNCSDEIQLWTNMRLKLCSIFQQQLVDAFVHCAVVYYIMHTAFKFPCARFVCVDRIWNEICKMYVIWIANIRKLNELIHFQFSQFHSRQMWYSNSVHSMPNMVLDYSNEFGPTCNSNERRRKKYSSDYIEFVWKRIWIGIGCIDHPH